MNDWFEQFADAHPQAADVIVTVFLLGAMGLAGWLDQPLVA
ncbi:hypothetical protein [Cupriavidus gilardii]|nr:hypothetical protein [Cupriavidus gilardii]MCT9125373.1 hypothetical protein [Cupriavidus gilardii]